MNPSLRHCVWAALAGILFYVVGCILKNWDLI